MNTFFRAFRCRPFVLLWSGQTISRLGDFVYEIALAWWVLEQTGSPLAMGTVLICSFVPTLLLLLVGGVAVDRWPRVPLMIVADSVRGVIGVVLALLAVSGQLHIWQVYVASVLLGTVDAFFQPAYTALVPEITPQDDLTSANALTSMGVQIGRVGGPVVSATLLATVGAAWAFAINGVTFFVAVLTLVPLLDRSSPRQVDRAPANVWSELRVGIRTVTDVPWLWITILMFAITNVTLAGPYSVAIPFLVRDAFAGNVQVLGLLYAMFPIGYIIGGLVVGQFMHVRRRTLIVYIGTLVAGLGLLTFGLPVGIVVLVIAALINGAALEMANLVWINMLQEMVPLERLGRVSSIEMLGSFALLPVGFGVASWATSVLGAAEVLFLGGAITVVCTALGLAHPAVRAVD
jgi:MFS family permease